MTENKPTLYYIEFEYMADGENETGSGYIYTTPFGLVRMYSDSDEMLYKESLEQYLYFYDEYKCVRVL